VRELDNIARERHISSEKQLSRRDLVTQMGAGIAGAVNNHQTYVCANVGRALPRNPPSVPGRSHLYKGQPPLHLLIAEIGTETSSTFASRSSLNSRRIVEPS
jgi:hypothetical protein